MYSTIPITCQQSTTSLLCIDLICLLCLGVASSCVVRMWKATGGGRCFFFFFFSCTLPKTGVFWHWHPCLREYGRNTLSVPKYRVKWWTPLVLDYRPGLYILCTYALDRYNILQSTLQEHRSTGAQSAEPALSIPYSVATDRGKKASTKDNARFNPVYPVTRISIHSQLDLSLPRCQQLGNCNRLAVGRLDFCWLLTLLR